jgi:hypothetical protein
VHRCIGQFYVWGVSIGIAVYGNGAYAHVAASADNAAGYFAPVGYKNTVYHFC